MSVPPDSPSDIITGTRHTPLRGIAFKVASVCVFLVMSSLLKASQGIPAGELVFFRSAFAIVPVVIYLALRRELIVGFKTAYPLGHVWRGLVGTGGMVFGFYALTQLPLPEAIALSYATPLVIVVFSALFYHERVRLYRWSAVTDRARRRDHHHLAAAQRLFRRHLRCAGGDARRHLVAHRLRLCRDRHAAGAAAGADRALGDDRSLLFHHLGADRLGDAAVRLGDANALAVRLSGRRRHHRRHRADPARPSPTATPT